MRDVTDVEKDTCWLLGRRDKVSWLTCREKVAWLTYVRPNSIYATVSLPFGKRERTRSRLYRSQRSQPNTRWKTLDEISQIYLQAHLPDLKHSENVRHEFFFW